MNHFKFLLEIGPESLKRNKALINEYKVTQSIPDLRVDSLGIKSVKSKRELESNKTASQFLQIEWKSRQKVNILEIKDLECVMVVKCVLLYFLQIYLYT